MYDEGCYYDTHDPASSISIGGAAAAGGDFPSHPLMGGTTTTTCSNNNNNNSLEENLRLSLEEFSNHHHNHNPSNEAAATMDFELEHELNTHLMQDVLHDPHNTISMPPSLEQQSWDMQYHHHHHGQQIDLQSLNPNPFTTNHPPYAQTPTPDLLNLFHLPRYSMLPHSSISFTNPNKKPAGNFPSSLDIFGGEDRGSASSSNVVYDSQLHLDLPPQQTPIFKELFHSLPHNYGSRGGMSNCFFGGMDERDQVTGGPDGDHGRLYHENSMLDFSGLGKGGDHGKGAKQHFATERQRREQLNDKYKALRLLVPNPTKGDRASIVHDAIEYIKELLRTVDELKILVDKKRYGRERRKKLKTEESGDMESSSMKPLSSSLTHEREQSNGTSRSSWLQRKSKETEVDVRIIDDEVTIKLIQRKKMNCLLSVAKILDELQLDLLHVSGGHIGHYYSFLFNTKIYEGSCVYACAIANKLIEAVDKNHTAFQPGATF